MRRSLKTSGLTTQQRRDLGASRANQKWTTDMTYIWVENKWLYLATVM